MAETDINYTPSDAQFGFSKQDMQVITAAKQIPGFGEVVSAVKSVGDFLIKIGLGPQPDKFLSEKLMSEYNANKDKLYFVAIHLPYPNGSFVTNGVSFQLGQNVLDYLGFEIPQGQTYADIVDLTRFKPVIDDAIYFDTKYQVLEVFPNRLQQIIRAQQEKEQLQIQQELQLQLQQQQIAQEKSTYGPFYSIINWFRTTTIGDDFKAGASQIGESIKTTTGIQTTWETWVIGGLTVAGALAITYVILED